MMHIRILHIWLKRVIAERNSILENIADYEALQIRYKYKL